FSVQDARLVLKGNEKYLHKLRDWLQHNNRNARRCHLSADASREQRCQLLLDVRLRPPQLRLRAIGTPIARTADYFQGKTCRCRLANSNRAGSGADKTVFGT